MEFCVASLSNILRIHILFKMFPISEFSAHLQAAFVLKLISIFEILGSSHIYTILISVAFWVIFFFFFKCTHYAISITLWVIFLLRLNNGGTKKQTNKKQNPKKNPGTHLGVVGYLWQKCDCSLRLATEKVRWKSFRIMYAYVMRVDVKAA